jgi:hypothetical protein
MPGVTPEGSGVTPFNARGNLILNRNFTTIQWSILVLWYIILISEECSFQCTIRCDQNKFYNPEIWETLDRGWKNGSFGQVGWQEGAYIFKVKHIFNEYMSSQSAFTESNWKILSSATLWTDPDDQMLFPLFLPLWWPDAAPCDELMMCPMTWRCDQWPKDEPNDLTWPYVTSTTLDLDYGRFHNCSQLS